MTWKNLKLFIMKEILIWKYVKSCTKIFNIKCKELQNGEII